MNIQDRLPLINRISVLLACLWLVLLFFTLSPNINDFQDYWRGAVNVVQSGDPYLVLSEQRTVDVAGQAEQIAGGQRAYIYPPFLAYALQPLALLPKMLAQHIWFALNISALAGLLLQFFKISPPAIRQYWGIILLLIVVAPPTRVTLQLGQISIILSILIIGSFVLSRKRPALAGTLLAVAVLIKLYPALLAFYYLLDRHRRAAFWWTGLCGLGLLGLSLLMHGITPYVNFLTKAVLLQDAYPYAAEFNISFMGFWSRLFSSSRYGIPVSHQPELVSVLTILSSLILLGLCVWQSYRQPDNALFGFSLWICCMLIISPANGYYSLVSLLMPIAALADRKLKHEQSGWLRQDLWLVLAIALICVPPGWTNALPWLYERMHIGWGTLFLTPAFYGLLMVVMLLLQAKPVSHESRT